MLAEGIEQRRLRCGQLRARLAGSLPKLGGPGPGPNAFGEIERLMTELKEAI